MLKIMLGLTVFILTTESAFADYKCTQNVDKLLSAVNTIATPGIWKMRAKLKELGHEVTNVEFVQDEHSGKVINSSWKPYEIFFPMTVKLDTADGNHYTLWTGFGFEKGEPIYASQLYVSIWVKDTGVGKECEYVRGQNITASKNHLVTFLVVDPNRYVITEGLFDIYTVRERKAPKSGSESNPGNREYDNDGRGYLRIPNGFCDYGNLRVCP